MLSITTGNNSGTCEISGLAAATASFVYGDFHKHLFRVNMKQANLKLSSCVELVATKKLRTYCFATLVAPSHFVYGGIEHSHFATRALDLEA